MSWILKENQVPSSLSKWERTLESEALLGTHILPAEESSIIPIPVSGVFLSLSHHLSLSTNWKIRKGVLNVVPILQLRKQVQIVSFL